MVLNKCNSLITTVAFIQQFWFMDLSNGFKSGEQEVWSSGPMKPGNLHAWLQYLVHFGGKGLYYPALKFGQSQGCFVDGMEWNPCKMAVKKIMDQKFLEKVDEQKHFMKSPIGSNWKRQSLVSHILKNIEEAKRLMRS